jgi:hypothetical protein
MEPALQVVMLGKAILLFTSDRAGGRRLTTSLRAAGSEVVVVDSAATARDLIAARAVDLVLFDYSESWDLPELAWTAAGRVPFVVLSGESDASVLLEVVCDLGISHLLSSGADGSAGLAAMDVRDVVVTAEKILRGDIFGAAKYLPDFGVDLSSYEVRGADDRDELIECVQDYLGWLGAGRDMIQAMGLVVDELVTNAVYNAPRDEHGAPRYASTDRRHKIQLDPWERAQVQFGSDGRMFVFSISDWFGGLTPARIRAGLRRCLSAGDQIEQKAGGAGLGLYTVLQSVTQLIINVDPGRRTEVIAIVDLTQRMRGVRAGGHSIQLFTREGEADARRTGADTVVVSDELRSELLSALAPQKQRGVVIPLVEPKPARRRPVARFDTEESGIYVDGAA